MALVLRRIVKWHVQVEPKPKQQPVFQIQHGSVTTPTGAFLSQMETPVPPTFTHLLTQLGASPLTTLYPQPRKPQ